jgi:hypothetical protein
MPSTRRSPSRWNSWVFTFCCCCLFFPKLSLEWFGWLVYFARPSQIVRLDSCVVWVRRLHSFFFGFIASRSGWDMFSCEFYYLDCSQMVQGTSAKHARGQKVGLEHVLDDEDVVTSKFYPAIWLPCLFVWKELLLMVYLFHSHLIHSLSLTSKYQPSSCKKSSKSKRNEINLLSIYKYIISGYKHTTMILFHAYAQQPAPSMWYMDHLPKIGSSQSNALICLVYATL